MIELKVESYCNECPDFDADVSKTQWELYSPDSGRMEINIEHTIRCKYARRCSAMVDRLKKAGKYNE